VAIAPDGKSAALASCARFALVNSSNPNLWRACVEGRVLVLDLQATRLRYELVGHKNWVSSLAFSPDGKTLASGSRDGTILLWDTDRRKVVDFPLLQKGWVRSLAFSPDGKTLASGGCSNPQPIHQGRSELCQTGEIRLWD